MIGGLGAALLLPGMQSLIHGNFEGAAQRRVYALIDTDARPLALQVALLIPLLAALVGLFNSFRMMRLPDPAPSSAVEGVVVG